MYLNNLQSYIFGFLTILFMGFIACEKNSNEDLNFNFNQNLKLSENTLISVGNNQNLNLVIDKILDSRCPVNADCIGAGNASVSLKITDNQNGLVKLKLNFGQESNFKPDSANFNLNSKSYIIILNNVSPYPQSDNSNIVKEADLIVKLKN